MYKIQKKDALSLAILEIISNEEIHGYKIAEKLSEKYGITKLSSGLLYPILQELRDGKLVEVSESRSREKKIYRITEEGIKYLSSNRERLEEAKTYLKNFGTFQKIGGEELLSSLKTIIIALNKLSENDIKNLEKSIKEFSKKLKKILKKVNE